MQEKPTVRALNEVSFQGATPLALAAEVNNLEAVKALVEGGADPTIATEQGTTPLILAAGAGTDVQRARTLEERAMAVADGKVPGGTWRRRECRRTVRLDRAARGLLSGIERRR